MINKSVPKYSIILPVKNVRPYIGSAINSVLSQEYSDYELIISDNQSDDGTAEYVDTIYHENVKVFHIPRAFSLSEHFDWAQSHAAGMWQIYLGGDDALQPYFFILADRLTGIAYKNNISAISSRRVYYFWNGCQANKNYGDSCVSYSAKNEYKILSAKKEMYKALYGQLDCSFFDLPQMYTTSLFHKSLIDEVKKRQSGVFIPPYTTQDAYLAALSVLFSENILRSEIPLGWVGCSPKTAFREKTWNNNFKLRREVGSFSIGINKLYLWNSLLTIMETIPVFRIDHIFSSLFKIKMYGYALADIMYTNDPVTYASFLKVVAENNCNIGVVKFYSKLSFISMKILKCMKYILIFPWRCIRYILKRIPWLKKYFIKSYCSLYLSWHDAPDMTIEKASAIIMKLISENINFEDL